MTKLESDIEKALMIFDHPKEHEGRLHWTSFVLPDEQEAMVKAAAEVCKGYIERAFDAGKKYKEHDDYCNETGNLIPYPPDKIAWLKSEGITE